MLTTFFQSGKSWNWNWKYLALMNGEIPGWWGENCDQATLYSTSCPNRPPIPSSWPMSGDRARRLSSNWPAHKFEPSTISTFHHHQTCDPVNNMSSWVLYEIIWDPEKAKGMLCDIILPWWFSSAPTWLVLTVLTENQAVNSRSRVWDISLPFQPMPCWALFPSHILSHPTTTAINQYYLSLSTDTMWSKAILSQSQGSKLIKYWTLFFGFLSRGYLFYFPPPLPFRGWFWKLLP